MVRSSSRCWSFAYLKHMPFSADNSIISTKRLHNLHSALNGSKKTVHSLHTCVKLSDIFVKCLPIPMVDNKYQLMIGDLRYCPSCLVWFPKGSLLATCLNLICDPLSENPAHSAFCENQHKTGNQCIDI